jgi:hypothetical protein
MTSWLDRPRAVFALTMLSLAVFAATFPARSESAERQDDFRWDEEVPAGSTLRVFTVAGTVTVRQSDGRTARVRGETRNEDDDRIRYVTQRAGDGVRICALREGATCEENGISSNGRGWRGDRRARANFTIEVPRGVVVRVSSGNGDVRVEGATADVHATSGNGDVSVGSGAATVRATSGNGAVRVDAAREGHQRQRARLRLHRRGPRGGVDGERGDRRVDGLAARTRRPGVQQRQREHHPHPPPRLLGGAGRVHGERRRGLGVPHARAGPHELAARPRHHRRRRPAAACLYRQWHHPPPSRRRQLNAAVG